LIGAESAKPGDAAPAEPLHLGVTVAVDCGAVLDVDLGSPAARAGVTPGDVVLSINGEAVRNGAELRAAVARLGPGREVVLVVERSGQAQEIRALLESPTTAAPA
jgi:S1-C subfamily serine protease